ncbi:TerD family protein [Streptomyces beihaiensis]|uniref:Tellurium resistance TerZ family protein n=1 Tax=Streptomyces beihaiensis TaxID=2984495 RepID=A0ABT3U146_9ACTN|nr:TerD family protein [Streptomyces beihaiensis]MCX3061975.1 tellurium resistance TerZ family protein [Streptomyces beihaiensis]
MPVLMAKGQRLPLNGPDGRPLNLISMGIGWQPALRPGLLGALGPHRRGRLGSFAVLYGRGRFLDALFSENPTNPDESIEHSTGLPSQDTAGEDDTESFAARLSRLPPHADRVVFAVSSFDGSTFETVHSAHCRLVDESRGLELARYVFPAQGPHTALILADLTRAAGAEWTMTALGEPAACATFADLLRAIERHG